MLWVVSFQVLTAVRITFLWVVTLCRLVGRYHAFGGKYCLHLLL
jgi:hypothetical protein